jgi:predicted phage terminase large subunit-like protein
MANYNKILLDYDAHCKRIAQATSININETPAEKVKRIKYLEADYVRWFEYYFPNYAKKPCAWFHKKLAKMIIYNKRIRALAEWFRSAAKSVHIDMGIPLFLYLVMRDLFFMLLIGETEPKAKKLLSGIQAQLQHNKRLINDYGEKFKFGDWSDGDFTTTDGVKFQAIGFGQNPRGSREDAERPDYIVVDDVDSKKHVNNDTLMREAVDFITEDVWGCFDSVEDGTERFIFANNNFHKNSITNRLKQYFKTASENCKQMGDEDIFKVFTVTAVKDTINFEPNWAEKTTAEYWRKKYNSMPTRSFMREYMHIHIEDGAIFKYEDIVWGEVLPLQQYDGLVFYGDLSYKAQADFKGMFLIGKIGRKYHIIYSFLRQKSRSFVAEWLYNLYTDRRLERFNIKYYIEGLFAMDEFVNDFDIEGDKRGFHIPVVADKRSKSNKYDRVESLSGYFERHDVIFNIAEKMTPDQVTLIDQFLAFEKGSKAHDDGPDAVHGAISELNKITFVEQFPVRTTSREQLRNQNKNRF